MTQLCCSSDTYQLLLSLLHDHLFSSISFLTSHPLYFAYFLFFLPRLFPLISFLFPLLFSTSTLFLLLFLHSNQDADEEDNAAALLDQLGGNVFEWEFEAMVELYKENGEDPVEIFLESSDFFVKEDPIVLSSAKNRIFEHNSDLVSLTGSPSTRKEKEWKRTLACKLYEERMTFKLCEDRTITEGAEEMDLLWEAYEANADKNDIFEGKNDIFEGKKEKHVGEEGEEEMEEGPVQLCCLQALRLSTGKMNLGVRRLNLQKISKVFKGIGFFHHRAGSRRKG